MAQRPKAEFPAPGRWRAEIRERDYFPRGWFKRELEDDSELFTRWWQQRSRRFRFALSRVPHLREIGGWVFRGLYPGRRARGLALALGYKYVAPLGLSVCGFADGSHGSAWDICLEDSPSPLPSPAGRGRIIVRWFEVRSTGAIQREIRERDYFPRGWFKRELEDDSELFTGLADKT